MTSIHRNIVQRKHRIDFLSKITANIHCAVHRQQRFVNVYFTIIVPLYLLCSYEVLWLMKPQIQQSIYVKVKEF